MSGEQLQPGTEEGAGYVSPEESADTHQPLDQSGGELHFHADHGDEAPGGLARAVRLADVYKQSGKSASLKSSDSERRLGKAYYYDERTLALEQDRARVSVGEQPSIDSLTNPELQAFKSLSASKERLEDAKEGGDPEAIRRAEEMVGSDQQAVNDVLEDLSRRIKAQIERGRSSANSAYNEGIKVFEELYDSDPARFSSMSVEDFLEVARQVSKLEEELADRESAAEKFDDAREAIKRAINERDTTIYDKILGSDDQFGIHSLLMDAVYSGGGDEGAVFEELRKLREDLFEFSPKSLLEQYAKILDRIEAELDIPEKIKRAREARDGFLAQHKQDAPAEQEQASEA